MQLLSQKRTTLPFPPSRSSIISMTYCKKDWSMNAQKLSISLPEQQCKFIEQYQLAHHYKTRSEVIKQALYVLQQTHLEAAYREANAEIDDSSKRVVLVR